MLQRENLQSSVRFVHKERETLYSTIEVSGTPSVIEQPEGHGVCLCCPKQPLEGNTEHSGKPLAGVSHLRLFRLVSWTTRPWRA